MVSEPSACRCQAKEDNNEQKFIREKLDSLKREVEEAELLVKTKKREIEEAELLMEKKKRKIELNEGLLKSEE